MATAVAVGANEMGQLGVGNLNPSGLATYEVVTALKTKQAPVAVAAGHRFAGAITASDNLFMWGAGGVGQLGGGASMPRSTRPNLVVALRTKRVLAVACGGSHTLAVVTDGGGSGGTSTLTMGPLPRGSAVHNGAVGGALYVWGASLVGALGLGMDAVMVDTPTLLPLPAVGGAGGGGGVVTYIAAGSVSSAAVVGGHSLFVWGDASYGRLGLGSRGEATTPTPQATPCHLPLVTRTGVPLSPQAVALGGTLSAFIGRPASAPPGAPGCLLVAGMPGADAAVLETDVEGKVDLMGGVVMVHLRRPAGDTPTTPLPPVLLTPTPTAALGEVMEVVAVAAGPTHYAVVVRESKGTSATKLSLLEAAHAAAGAAGAPLPPPPPPPSGGGGGAAAAAAASASATPVRIRGVLYTAGFGLLGHARPAAVAADCFASPEPVAVVGAVADEDVVEVACGYYTTYARNLWGEMFAWGGNEFGGLGTGKYAELPLPTTCAEPDNAHYEQIAAGAEFCVTLRYPGLLGDARARALAKNAFGKWRRKAAAARGAVPSVNKADLSLMCVVVGGAYNMVACHPPPPTPPTPPTTPSLQDARDRGGRGDRGGDAGAGHELWRDHWRAAAHHGGRGGGARGGRGRPGRRRWCAGSHGGGAGGGRRGRQAPSPRLHAARLVGSLGRRRAAAAVTESGAPPLVQRTWVRTIVTT